MLGGPEKIPNFKIANRFGEGAWYLCVFPELRRGNRSTWLRLLCVFVGNKSVCVCVCKETNPT